MTNIEVLSIVIALSFGVFSIVGTMLTLFLWNRGESRNEKRRSEDAEENLQFQIWKMHQKLNNIKRK